MGEGLKPEQLYIFIFLYFIWNRNLILYICIKTSSLDFF